MVSLLIYLNKIIKLFGNGLKTTYMLYGQTVQEIHLNPTILEVLFLLNNHQIDLNTRFIIFYLVVV